MSKTCAQEERLVNLRGCPQASQPLTANAPPSSRPAHYIFSVINESDRKSGFVCNAYKNKLWPHTSTLPYILLLHRYGKWRKDEYSPMVSATKSLLWAIWEARRRAEEIRGDAKVSIAECWSETSKQCIDKPETAIPAIKILVIDASLIRDRIVQINREPYMNVNSDHNSRFYMNASEVLIQGRIPDYAISAEIPYTDIERSIPSILRLRINDDRNFTGFQREAALCRSRFKKINVSRVMLRHLSEEVIVEAPRKRLDGGVLECSRDQA